MSRTRPPATTGRRIAAYLVDLLVLGPALVAVAAVAFDTRRERLLRGGAVALVAANLYHVLLEGATGQTPGKRALDVEVVLTDGGACTLRAATVRTLARFLDFLPVGYLAAFVSMAGTDRRRRLGDLLGGTVVVGEGEAS